MLFEDSNKDIRGYDLIGVAVHNGQDLLDRRRPEAHSHPNIVQPTRFFRMLLLIYIHQQDQPVELKNPSDLCFGNDDFCGLL
jgi:hypothetical protein